MQPRTYFTEKDIEKIISLYTKENMSANQISILYGTSHNVVIRNLKKAGVQTRDFCEAQFVANGKEYNELLLDAEWLSYMHWSENKSCKEIGEILGYDAGTIRRHMKELSVKTKTNAESKIGLKTGENHPNWQGGITSLNKLLREYFHTNQIPKIAKRDKYTCQLCGEEHTTLHVHHINFQLLYTKYYLKTQN